MHRRMVDSAVFAIMGTSDWRKTMFASVITSVIAYTGTKIDDSFVLMILLASGYGTAKRKHIAGHFPGVGLITRISMPGMFIILDSGLLG